jgi:two-component system, cell cycle sensor histidine kinase and response regulator CckA
MASRKKVLIVDDEPAVLNVVARMVERLGYVAVSTLNGKEALQILEKENIELLLLDVVLKDMTVVELANKSHSYHGRRKIIFMSGHFPHLEINFPRSIPFLQKPFTMEELRVALEQIQLSAAPLGELESTGAARVDDRVG